MTFIWWLARYGKLTYCQRWLSNQWMSDRWVMRQYAKGLR